jgi:hypothetical protein
MISVWIWDLGDNSCQNGARIITYKNLPEQESIIIPYYENNADPAAVVRFQF